MSKNDSTGCVLWDGYFGNDGYGRIGHKRRKWLAHRFMWMQEVGPIPDGMCVLHRCDNPACVSLDHLFLGTKGDNNRDKTQKGRQARGSGAGHSVLEDYDVKIIRLLAANGVPQPWLARQYKVAQSNISRIVASKTWRHVL